MDQEREMLKKCAILAPLVMLLFSSAVFAAPLPDGQATRQSQTNAQSSSKSGNQKKNANQKDADKAAQDKAAQDKAAQDKAAKEQLAKEDKLSKERYSTRGLHPPYKTSDGKTQGDSGKQNPPVAAKSDTKNSK
jgi:hypothetical protein